MTRILNQLGIHINKNFRIKKRKKISNLYNGDNSICSTKKVEFGAKNGITNGLTILADVEIFDYAYFHRASSGFMIALADNRGGFINYITQ